MLYYSEILKKNFPTAEQCVEEEEKYKAKIEEEKAAKEALNKQRSARIAEVEEAYKNFKEAEKRYNDLKIALAKDYNFQFFIPYRGKEKLSKRSELDLMAHLFDLFGIDIDLK